MTDLNKSLTDWAKQSGLNQTQIEVIWEYMKMAHLQGEIDSLRERMDKDIKKATTVS